MFEPDVRVCSAESWRVVEELPAFVVVAVWFVEPVLVFGVSDPKLMDDVVTLIALSVLTVEVELSFVLVAPVGSVKRTLALQPTLGKLDDASVALAKYCTANVVVTLILVPFPTQLLVAVNAVAL